MTWLRGRVLHCLAEPGSGNQAVEYFEDAVMQIDAGRIAELLPTREAASKGLDPLLCKPVTGLIVPGFIDTHVHAPQLDIIGSYGEQLLAWLERYTFPAEERFADPELAEAGMNRFLDAMLLHGTTSAMVFSTSHEAATNLLFAAARQRSLCLIAGKVLMDRNAPESLLDTADSGTAASRRLIRRWHGSGRLRYAVSPRFAITSTAAQLAAAGGLVRELEGVYLQTHLAEHPGEIAEVSNLFPDAAHYLDTYDAHGLCTERSVFAHCVHLTDEEQQRLADSGARVCLCPSSNMFLGSGLYDWASLADHGIPLALGSDVGAGTSLSMLRILADAYRVCQLQGMSLAPFEALHAITLGNARALHLDDSLGNLAPGKDADFVVLDAAGNPHLEKRLKGVRSIEEEWFVYMTMGDERLVAETWVAGKPACRGGEVLA